MMINLRFNQLRLNYLNNQNKSNNTNNNKNKTEKYHLRFVIISIRVGVFAKNDIEICS